MTWPLHILIDFIFNHLISAPPLESLKINEI